ncbi:glycoside hydrolase family 16 protein [Bradyrhizobium sp. TZ2]
MSDGKAEVGFGYSSFVDPSSGYDPFKVEGGALTITATGDVTPSGWQGSMESGLITTEGNWSQKQGYFEMRADLSDGPHAWDAFWMLPVQQVNLGTPDAWQELDVVEHYGDNDKGVYSTIHTTDPQNGIPWQENRQVYSELANEDGYHAYGVLWEDDKLSFYVDGEFKGSQATPSDYSNPQYMIANLATKDGAVGGEQMKIDYIRAYSNDGSNPTVALGEVSPPDGHDPGMYGATALDGSATAPVDHTTDMVVADPAPVEVASDTISPAAPAVVAADDVPPAAPAVADAEKNISNFDAAPAPKTPSSIAPVLTVADPTLSVTGRGGTLGLGVKVATTDPNDNVTVNIKGLPWYETITDGLGHTFRGRNITLTEAQVDSGLTLHSYYRGSRDPIDTPTLTATAKDPVTGAVATSASQKITVTDPPAATATAPQTTTVTAPAPGTATTTASPSSYEALFSQLRDLVADSGVATSAPRVINMTDTSPATGTTTASLTNQSFALLNQYLAGNTGRFDPGQIVAAASNGTTWGQDSFLTRPQH